MCWVPKILVFIRFPTKRIFLFKRFWVSLKNNSWQQQIRNHKTFDSKLVHFYGLSLKISIHTCMHISHYSAQLSCTAAVVFFVLKKKKIFPNLYLSPLHELWKVFYRAIPVPQMIFHYPCMNIPICIYLLFTYIFKVSTFFILCVFIYISYLLMYLKVLLSLNRFYILHSQPSNINS